MRKICIILGALAFVACNNTSSKSENTAVKPATTEQLASGEALIAKSDCLTCHTIDKKIIGPAYQDVANHYDATEENKELLADRIINGSKGTWGDIPMTPHSNISKEDAKEMVTYIFSLKK